MNRPLRILGVLCLFAVLVAATGFVMVRNRKMSLFLEARDAIERGEPPARVLGELRRRIDWPPASKDRAVAVAKQALGAAATAPPLTLYRAGDWALLVRGPELRLLTRTRHGWRPAP